MGKDVRASAQFTDGESEGRLLWEPPKLIFRGAMRGTFQGHALRGVRAEGADLVLADGTRFTLDDGPAEIWVHAILNPPGRLDKLGVKPGQTIVVQDLDDPDFLAELATRAAPVEALEGIDLLFYGVDSPEQLELLGELADGLGPKGALWIVAIKGKAATVKDGEIRAAARDQGLVDTKVCAFSKSHTALKFVKRKGLAPAAPVEDDGFEEDEDEEG
jgi:hypothetical protein